MMLSYGLAAASSGFLIPQLENPDIGFGISVEEGSWLCKFSIWLIYNSIVTHQLYLREFSFQEWVMVARVLKSVYFKKIVV